VAEEVGFPSSGQLRCPVLRAGSAASDLHFSSYT
jgi:hypothetical protein